MNNNTEIKQRLQSREGIVVKDIHEIQIIEDKLLAYQGNNVLVYIRDQIVNPQETDREYKYHVSYCKTLKEMKNKKRFERYVLTNRTDSYFSVNLRDFSSRKIVEKDIFIKMNVCKNCLKKLQYQGYKNHLKDKKIYEKFNLKEFFTTYQTYFEKEPTHDAETAPEDEYADFFDQIAYSLKDLNDWRCQECGIKLKDDKEFLDAHHVNGIKSDNRPENLRCLCVKCHASQPLHSHLKLTNRYKRFVKKYS
jgi:ribosomal protein L28